MKKEKKRQIVEELKERLSKAKSIVLADYSGLSVPQQENLRNKVKEAGGEFTVVKNTLLKLAFQNSQFSIFNFQLQGPTATLFAFEDEIAPIKALVEFSEEFKLLKVKIGFFEGKLIEKGEILELAKIPSRKELLTKLVYTINWPLSGLVNVLGGNMRNLILIISNLKEGGEN